MGGTDHFRASVNQVMFAIAAGCEQAIFELHQLAEPYLARMARAEARRAGVRLGDDDVFGVTLDAAIELGRMARSWSPDGALPWVWARKRIHGLVHRQIGQLARELDDEVLLAERREAPVRHVPMEEPVAALRRLAEHHAGARELQERLERLVSPRDASIYLTFQVERDGGNRSPAVTVAVDHDLQPAAVRKVVQRVGERLAADEVRDAGASVAGDESLVA